MTKPAIFIGSSSEGLEVAQAIQFQLQQIAKTKVWNEGIFGLGQSTLESLFRALDVSDFAILVLRGEDTVVSRDVASASARDNVLFELGLFMGRLGRSKTFVVFDKHKPPKIISDLAGITFAPFDGGDSDLLTAVGPACFLIRQAINKEPDEKWYTEWHLGSKIYKETLELFKLGNNYLKGKRIYEEEGGATQIFGVNGFSGMGLYWLEYHRDDGAGGGTLLLHHIGTGKMKGLITAGHCDTAVLRCYCNQWVIKGSEDYKEEWLQKIGEAK